MKYTILDEADKKIDDDMKVLVEQVRKRIPGVLSIILTGSFSRGEGPVKEFGGKFYPYNDYDIQVVVKKKVDKKNVDKMSIEISKQLGYKGIGYFYNFKKEDQKMKENFYVDLKVDTIRELKKMMPRIRIYELRNESLLLWGKDLRELIPDFKLDIVPLSEGAKLLIDRMSQLVEYYSIDGRYENEFLTYIIQQAYTAICTSLLMLKKNHQIGYRKAMLMFKENYEKDYSELYQKIPDLDEKIQIFVNWKEKPQVLPYENVRKEWFIVKESILEVAKYFFSRFLRKEISSIEELSSAILNMRDEFYGPFLKLVVRRKIGINFNYKILLPLIPLYLKYKYFKRLENKRVKKIDLLFSKSPDLVISSSLIYLIGSINENGVDVEYLSKARLRLNKVYLCKGNNWEDLSLDYANAYIAFFMQKL